MKAPEMAFCDGGVCRAMFWEGEEGVGRECGCLQGCYFGDEEEGEGLVCKGGECVFSGGEVGEEGGEL